MSNVDNTQNVIDSRDIIERIEELEASDDENDAQEYKTLKALAEECERYAPDWKYGEVLIRDSYFKEYAQQLAEDCGMVSNCYEWPMRCIDWNKAAEELKQDYTSVNYDGVIYWIRS